MASLFDVLLEAVLPDVRVNVHGEGVRCGIKKALRLIEQAPTIEAQIPKWIPVGAEEKPLHGKEYLCVCTLPDDPEHKWDWMMVLRYYAYGSNGYVDRPHFTDEGVNGMTVTHWTHLPSHPLSE